MSEIERLRVLLAEATPGPWGRPSAALLRFDRAYVCKGPKGGGKTIADCGKDHADAAYIAAASPDVVAALVRVALAADQIAGPGFDEYDEGPMWAWLTLHDALEALDR